MANSWLSWGVAVRKIDAVAPTELIDTPTSGSISIDGTDVLDLSDNQKQVTVERAGICFPGIRFDRRADGAGKCLSAGHGFGNRPGGNMSNGPRIYWQLSAWANGLSIIHTNCPRGTTAGGNRTLAD